MGADAFIAFYGVRFEIGDADKADTLELQRDPRLQAAKSAKLDTHTGRLTDGEPHHLLIGKRLGAFGIEGWSAKSFEAAELAEIARTTDTILRANGFRDEEARFWLQLEAQY